MNNEKATECESCKKKDLLDRAICVLKKECDKHISCDLGCPLFDEILDACIFEDRSPNKWERR